MAKIKTYIDPHAVHKDANGAVILQSVAGLESAPLGAELTDNTGWTSADWTGDYDVGFTHVSGNTTSLSRTMPATGTNRYQVSFKVDATLGSLELAVTLGNSVSYDIYTGGGADATYTCGITSVSNGDLVFTPATGFDHKIYDISVKQITGAFDPIFTINDSTTGANTEIRSCTDGLENLFFGIGVGQYNTTGNRNLAFGTRSLTNNTTGFWNLAIGTDALEENTVGSRNTALGAFTLEKNISGHRNVAIGNLSLSRNTIGNYNIAVGIDSLWHNTTGSENIGIGYTALGSNTLGDMNIALGRLALSVNTVGNHNLAIGREAGMYITGDDNVCLGYRAGYRETGSDNFYVSVFPGTNLENGRAIALMYGHFDATTANQFLTVNGLLNVQGNVYPTADDTYYLGKNDDDTPFAWKGVILKDTTNGKYYRIEVINGVVTATDLTD